MIDDYSNNGRQESLRTWIEPIVNKFAISNHTALTLCASALRSYLKLICEYELHSLPNKKVSGGKVHGKNYIKVRLSLVHHLLRNRLLRNHYHGVKCFQKCLKAFVAESSLAIVFNQP